MLTPSLTQALALVLRLMALCPEALTLTSPQDFGERFVGPFREYSPDALAAALDEWIEEECYPIDRQRESIAGYMARCLAARRKGAERLLAVEQEAFFAAMRSNPELASQLQLPVSVAPVSHKLSRLADEAQSDMMMKISCRGRRQEAKVVAGGTTRGHYAVQRP